MLRRLTFLIAGAAIVVGACSSTPSAPALDGSQGDPDQERHDAEGRQVLPPEGRRRRRGQDRSDRPGERRWRPQPGGHDRRRRRRHRQQEGQDRVRRAGPLRRDRRDHPDRQRHLHQGQPARRQVHQDDLGGGRSGAAAAADPQKTIQELADFLNKPGVAPTKLPDEKCGDKDCYHVQLTLTGEELGGVGGVLPGASGAPEGSGTIDLWVQKDDMRPAKMTLALDLEEMGNIDVDGRVLELRRPRDDRGAAGRPGPGRVTPRHLAAPRPARASARAGRFVSAGTERALPPRFAAPSTESIFAGLRVGHRQRPVLPALVRRLVIDLTGDCRPQRRFDGPAEARRRRCRPRSGRDIDRVDAAGGCRPTPSEG